MKKRHDVAKIVGTGITVAGAMVMTLYKGPILEFIKSQGVGSHHGSSSSEASSQHWVTGTLMLLASCCGWASFFILQVSIYNYRNISVKMKTIEHTKSN